MRRTFLEYNGTELLSFICDPLNRMCVRKDMYYEQAAELKALAAQVRERVVCENTAEEFLTYEFEDPWSFPNDVGIPRHLNISQEEI